MSETIALGGPLHENLNTAETNEKKKTYRELGAERRKAFSEKIKMQKSWLSGWMDKAKSFGQGLKEGFADHAFAAPEMAADAKQAVNKKLVQWDEKRQATMHGFAEKMVGGMDNAGDAIMGRWNAMIEKGKSFIAAAQEKKRALLDAGRKAINDRRFNALRAKLDSELKNSMESRKRAEEIRQTMDLLHTDFVGRQAA